MGFLVVSLYQELLGNRDDANVVVYQEMACFGGPTIDVPRVESETTPLGKQPRRRREGAVKRRGVEEPLAEVSVALFRQEVVGEVVLINYPNGDGTFLVKVTAFLEEERFHSVDSAGYSQWDNDSFTDVIDLNSYYSTGHVVFQRHLSLIYRERELARRDQRLEKIAAKKRAAQDLEEKNKRRSIEAAADKAARSRQFNFRQFLDSGSESESEYGMADLIADQRATDSADIHVPHNLKHL